METKKILIVEDNPAIRKALERILEKSGYKTVSARDGRQAIDLLGNEVPDLIVSDIMMPNMNGYEFYKELRAMSRFNTVPFVFLTALNDEGDVRRGKELGVDDYITKPFKREDVLSVIIGKLKRREELNKTSEEEIDLLKKEIITTLSHEFKTPLTIIQGFTSLLLREDMGLNEEQLKEFLNYIKLGGERLGDLINDFIRMLEIDTGMLNKEVDLLSSPNDINLLIKNLYERYLPVSVKKGIKLSFEAEDYLPILTFSAKHISLALEKIIDNSFKFSDSYKKNKFVKIRSLKRDNNVLIEIEDNGIGIHENEFFNIFEKFYQIERKKYEQAGSGLGLCIARSYIKINSGNVSLISTPGRGTTFIISLPVIKGKTEN